MPNIPCATIGHLDLASCNQRVGWAMPKAAPVISAYIGSKSDHKNLLQALFIHHGFKKTSYVFLLL